MAGSDLDERGAVGPASAGGVADLAVGVTGTTLAATSSGKISDITLTNRGPGAATRVVLTFDLAGLDRGRVSFEVPDARACAVRRTGIVCHVIDVPVGQSLDVPVRLIRRGGPGPAGKVKVSVRHAGTDPAPRNDAVTVPVTVAGNGPDLYAYAPDVPFDAATRRVGGVPPGGTATLRYEIGNAGDEPVAGIRVTVRLPRHVAFAGSVPGCVVRRGIAVCAHPRLSLVPADRDTDARDRVYSAVRFTVPVKVSSAAPAPGTLTGGLVSVESITASGPGSAGDAGPAGPALRVESGRPAPATDLPYNAVGGRSGADVDRSDNSDEFAVVVASSPGSAGGLPVTGVRTTLIGGVGLGALLAGTILVLLAARRRRVGPIMGHPLTAQIETPTARRSSI